MGLKLKDSRGRESKTLFFVTVSWAVVVVRYALGGLETPLGTMPETTASDFGLAVAAILAIWLGREWREAKFNEPD